MAELTAAEPTRTRRAAPRAALVELPHADRDAALRLEPPPRSVAEDQWAASVPGGAQRQPFRP